MKLDRQLTQDGYQAVEQETTSSPRPSPLVHGGEGELRRASFRGELRLPKPDAHWGHDPALGNWMDAPRRCLDSQPGRLRYPVPEELTQPPCLPALGHRAEHRL